MKKKLLLLLSLLGIFTFASCQGDNSIPGGGNVHTSSQQSSSNPLPDSNDVVNGKVTYTGFYENELQYDFTYKDEYFKNTAVEVNNDLAKLSLCNALTGTNSNKDEDDYYLSFKYIEDFYSKCGFKMSKVPAEYNEKPTKDSIGCYCCKKRLVFDNKPYTIFGITIRGFKYGSEWASNFTLGTSRNHEGFDKAAESVMRFISASILVEKETSDIKVWITGYSRGGAVAGLTSTKLIEKNLVSEENLYCYTFEAPASLGMEDNREYKSIYNYINPNDIVTYLVHPTLNIKRPGTDINYTSGKNIDDVKAKLAQISQKVVLSELKTIGDLPYFLNNTVDIIYTRVFNARNEYCDKYQETARYLCDFFFGLPKAKRTQLINYFKGLSFLQLASLLSLESGKTLFKTAFETCQIEYDEATFNTHYEKILNLVVNSVIPTLGGDTISQIYQNVSVIAQNHFAEVTLAYMMA